MFLESSGEKARSNLRDHRPRKTRLFEKTQGERMMKGKDTMPYTVQGKEEEDAEGTLRIALRVGKGGGIEDAQEAVPGFREEGGWFEGRNNRLALRKKRKDFGKSSHQRWKGGAVLCQRRFRGKRGEQTSRRMHVKTFQKPIMRMQGEEGSREKKGTSSLSSRAQNRMKRGDKVLAGRAYGKFYEGKYLKGGRSKIPRKNATARSKKGR